MQVLYTQADGSKLIYEREDGELVYGYVLRPDGKQYKTKPVESILARGYWEVAEGLTKHLQGQHDQRTHGSWAGGGVGVDIRFDMDVLFLQGNGLPNEETKKVIAEMDATDIAAGRAYGDNALKIIAERQGFTGKPKTVETIADLQEIQKTEGGTIVYRGIANYSAEAAEKMLSSGGEISYTAEQALTDFREGEYYAGWGMFGNGTYTTPNVETAVSYANVKVFDEGKLGNGKTMAMLIPKDAKMPSESEVKEGLKSLKFNNQTRTHENDIGRFLATRGYQAYDSGYVEEEKMGNIVVLDRSMLTVAVQAVEDQ